MEPGLPFYLLPSSDSWRRPTARCAALSYYVDGDGRCIFHSALTVAKMPERTFQRLVSAFARLMIDMRL